MLHLGTRDYTFYSAKHKVYTRIDYFLISSADTDKILRTEISPKTLSDHNWVSCDFSIAKTEKEECSWALNRGLVYSVLFKQKTIQAIQL